MGAMRGHWQIMEILRPSGDVDVPENPRLYMSFDQHIVQLTTSEDDIVGDDGRYVGQVTGDDLDMVFTFPYNNTPEKLALIAPWGIDETPVEVTVESLKGGNMILKIGENILTLRRF